MSIPVKTRTTLSTKGQLILPQAIRLARHWRAGTRLTVEDTDEGVLIKAAPIFQEASVDKVFGSLTHAGKARTIAQMDAAIAAEAKRRSDRD